MKLLLISEISIDSNEVSNICFDKWLAAVISFYLYRDEVHVSVPIILGNYGIYKTQVRVIFLSFFFFFTSLVIGYFNAIKSGVVNHLKSIFLWTTDKKNQTLLSNRWKRWIIVALVCKGIEKLALFFNLYFWLCWVFVVACRLSLVTECRLQITKHVWS